jgi:hypothetical protein
VNIQGRWYEIPFLQLSDCFKLAAPKLSQRRARPTNTSGIFGVARYAIKYRKRKRLLWQAMWRDADNKQHCKRFFVSTHGEREAKALAVAARRDAMAELHEELTRRSAIYE